MNKTFYTILFIIIYFISRNYISNYQNINDYIKIYKKNYNSKNLIIKKKKKLKNLEKITKKQKLEKLVSSDLKNFIYNRYNFKYNDYRVKYIKISKIKNKNIYYIKVLINYKVRKVTTLLTVISMFYKEDFIEKIKVENKYKISLYLNKNKLILSKVYKKYKGN